MEPESLEPQKIISRIKGSRLLRRRKDQRNITSILTVERYWTFVKEKNKTGPRSSNGSSMEMRTNSGISATLLTSPQNPQKSID